MTINAARLIAQAALAALIVTLCSTSASAQEGLPIQDNELLLGTSAGALMVNVRDDPNTRTSELQAGSALELVFVGLMNRGRSWLDGEITLGLVGLWLSGEGFEQTTHRGGRIQRSFLPGVSARGSAHLHPEWAAPVRLGAGAALSWYAAPAVGTFGRFELECSLGLELTRSLEDHLALDLVYGLPLIDGMVDEPGMEIVGFTHRLNLRVSYGF